MILLTVLILLGVYLIIGIGMLLLHVIFYTYIVTNTMENMLLIKHYFAIVFLWPALLMK